MNECSLRNSCKCAWVASCALMQCTQFTFSNPVNELMHAADLMHNYTNCILCISVIYETYLWYFTTLINARCAISAHLHELHIVRYCNICTYPQCSSKWMNARCVINAHVHESRIVHSCNICYLPLVLHWKNECTLRNHCTCAWIPYGAWMQYMQCTFSTTTHELMHAAKWMQLCKNSILCNATYLQYCSKRIDARCLTNVYVHTLHIVHEFNMQ